MTRLTEKEIGEIRKARKNTEEARRLTPWRAVSAFVSSTLIDPLLRQRNRNVTIAELKKLDDRILDDIGLERGAIAYVAHEMVKAKHPGVSLWERLATAYRVQRDSNATARELKGLPDALLADIGIARVDIDSIAQSLAEDRRRQAAPNPAVPGSLEARLDAALHPVRQAVAEGAEMVASFKGNVESLSTATGAFVSRPVNEVEGPQRAA